MSITPSKQTSVYRQVDAILKTEDIYGGRQVLYSVICPVDSLFKMANNTVLRGGTLNIIGLHVTLLLYVVVMLHDFH